MEYEIRIGETSRFNSLKKAFRKWAKVHPNFMTPHIVKLMQVGENIIIEISEGEGFDHMPLYGVSLRMYSKEEYSFKAIRSAEGKQIIEGQCFKDFGKALAYAQDAKKIRYLI